MEEWSYGKLLEEYHLKLFTAQLIEAIHPESKAEVPILRLIGGDSCNVIAFNSKFEICFVEQFRFGTNTVEYELPGGIIDKGETALEAIVRELREETGHQAVQLTFLGKVPANPVYMDHFVHHFFCRVEDERPKEQKLDEGEYINVHWLNTDTAGAWLRTGKIRHPHTLSAFFLLLAKNVDTSSQLLQALKRGHDL
jgi:ADP-ribose pyrophosphatase